jgi:hypothetical protein
LILPASTVPSDLVLAERYIASNGDPAQVANQPWDDSVKSLVRYPEVLKWMDQNLEWTTAVGDAFLSQPADVMNSIQALRAEAIAAGNLTDTQQQRVVREKTCARIVPAEPEVIYVPQYDPEVVYVQPYSEDVGPLLTFSAGFAVGSWLNYDCDWDRRGIYVGQWRPGWNQYRNWDRGDRDHWNEGPNWDRGDRDQNWDRWDQGGNWDRGDRGQNNGVVNVVNINSDTARQWQPSASSQRRQAQHQRGDRANARFSSVDALDANPQPGGASGPSIAGGTRWRGNHIPKPSRADFTSQTKERIRRNSRDSNASNASGGFPPSPSVDHRSANATPGAGAKYKARSIVAQRSGRRGTPLAVEGAPRNLSKHAQGGHHSTGRVNNQPATYRPMYRNKNTRNVDRSQSSSPQANNAFTPRMGETPAKHAAVCTFASEAKQAVQPPPAAAHHDGIQAFRGCCAQNCTTVACAPRQRQG